MAIPNNTPNDSKGTDKPKKDGWDKADIVGKFLIALVVAFIGWQVQSVVTTQNTGKDYMQIALNILEKRDLTQNMQKNIGLRKWAVDLLQHYSPVKLDDPTKDKLINGEVEIPFANRNSRDFGAPGPPFVFNAIAPHGQGFASVNADGVLDLSTRSNNKVTVYTELKSPKGLFYPREDGAHLIVYNNQTFMIFYLSEDYPSPGKSVPFKEVSPPNGISNIHFSDDRTMIIVTATDNKEIHYDLDGKEIK